MSALTVRLGKDEHEALRMYARRKGRSVQAVVQLAISKEIGAVHGDKYGAFDSGDPKITAEWDEHMQGFGQWL